MCGIAGIFAYGHDASPIDRDELTTIRDHMWRRGPDGSGQWHSVDGRVGLAHRRLSIIDLSDRALQPMQSGDGRFVVTFNGEIYNYQALRDALIRKGRVFRTTSDTEVLLHLYAEHGPDMLAELRGMFAFALWDNLEQTLFLARDPYGIKPLYYSAQRGTLRFASQVGALTASPTVSNRRDPAAQVGFLLFGHVPEPFTWREEIQSVPAGHWVRVARGRGPETHAYFSMADEWTHASTHALRVSEADLCDAMRPALRDSIHHHLVADVPVGAFLSAGIDSGALVGLMSEQQRTPIRTLTLGFDEYTGRADDEAPLASTVATHFGTEHTSRRVTRGEFERDLPAILQAMDQPSIDGINSWFVSKAAHELGLKVAVSGLGGDELLGGYPSFRDLPRWVRALDVPSRTPFLAHAWRDLAQVMTRVRPSLSPKLAGMLEFGGTYPGAYLLRRGLFLPSELDSVLPREIVDAGLQKLDPIAHIAARLQPMPQTPYARVAALEASLYMRNQLLRDTDWASMAWSLEVRVPLVDSVLLASVAPMLVQGIPGAGKRALAQAPRKKLPATIADRRKTGFTTPIAKWLADSKLLSRWRDVPALRRDECHWSRRFAFELMHV